MLQGHLRARGHHIQRSRVRAAAHLVEPSDAPTRKAPKINRRVYSVPSPNFIWHIDGNHKLVRWRLVLHHGIDGFSRLVVFGQFSSNNRADTVLSLFRDAIRKYGRPYKIRTDHGGENVDIWNYMVSTACSTDTRPVIVGSSVHNQRIERHNRSVNEQEICNFRQLFYELENEGILDPDNDTDLFCLHYVFLPRINRSLSEFIDAHNNHAISTSRNITPAQLFWINIHHSVPDNSFIANTTQGVNVQDLIHGQALPHVHVTETPNPLTQEMFQELHRCVDPLSPVEGKELYRRTVEIVGRMMLVNHNSSNSP
ncbi:uncharacterized protein LOC110252499 [Exaiptasia diaphana]|uniref:Integrase catalytic domain-containing protein n=1 Tax=Exaiptasia diaphana TaxID=2652724 RepID=A0A913Y679_EXADI|nr:uncharacterized protein LOC110252499 [Exaiptasia diaphana]